MKFHYPHSLRSGGGVTQESEKTLSLSSLPISPVTWSKTKVLHRSTTASEDEKGHHMASDNSNELGQAVFRLSGRKQVQVGPRISGASADSLVAEKQVAWQI
jgi:hypothetical protein